MTDVLDFLAVRESLKNDVFEAFDKANEMIAHEAMVSSGCLEVVFRYDDTMYKQVVLNHGPIRLVETEAFLNKWLFGMLKSGIEIDFIAIGHRLVLTRVSMKIFDMAISNEQIEEYKSKLAKQAEDTIEVSG